MNSKSVRWSAVPVIAAAAIWASLWLYVWLGLLGVQCALGCSLAGDTSCQCPGASAASAVIGLVSGFAPVFFSALVAPTHKRLVGVLTGACVFALHLMIFAFDLRAAWLDLLFASVGIALALWCITWTAKQGMSSNNALP